MVMLCLPNKEIARCLGMSEPGIDKQIGHIYAKCRQIALDGRGPRSRTELVTYLLRAGVVSIEDLWQ